jgi:hypothetical protein
MADRRRPSVTGEPVPDDPGGPCQATHVPAPVEVRPVRGPRDLRRFIDLPYRLHVGTPWIPPVRVERWMFLNRRLNAFFTHGRARYFLAWRGERVVGRITAQVDDAFNAFHRNRWGMFGFLEMEEDQEVVDALLAAAQDWLVGQRCDRMIGPMDFTINDESGLLVEGHDLEPMVKQPWHPPHYQRLCEGAGLAKAMDLTSWYLELGNRDRLDPRLPKLAARSRDRHGVTIRPLSRRHLRRELDDFADIYNDAWSGNWGFSPYDKADLDSLALELQAVWSPGWFYAAMYKGKPIGMAISILDINQVFKRMQGRLLPLGWWHLLTRHRYVDGVRVAFLGVKPGYQYTGAGALLYEEAFRVGADSPLQRGEAGWILETNSSMNRGLEWMAARVVKRFRVYERTFDTALP